MQSENFFLPLGRSFVLGEIPRGLKRSSGFSKNKLSEVLINIALFCSLNNVLILC